MNKLKGDCSIGHDTSILLYIQIFAHVRVNSSSTRHAYKSDICINTRKLYNNANTDNAECLR